MTPADLRDLLGVPFTDEQLAAATAPLEPLLVVAGAGSGKTSTTAARVVWLVATGQVEPGRVLGLTFTNKAAAELAARVRSALAQAGVARGEDDDEPVVSTYHAFAGRLVTEHGLRLGVEPRARLLADATRFQLAARVLRRHRGPVRLLTAPLPTLVGQLVQLESELAEHLVEPAGLVAHDAAWLARLDAALAEWRAQPRSKGHCDLLAAYAEGVGRRRELAHLVSAYREAKRELDAVDFGDQVALACRLAETAPDVGAAERQRAAVVLLDEYQDTSVAQRRMLVGLFGPPGAPGHPVTAVGDPCQAIYGWRGASVSNLDGFPQHFPRADGRPAAVLPLSVNMRSGGRLLAVANRVAGALRARHHVVELVPPPAKAELGELVVALHRSWADELAWVAARVRAEVDAGTPPEECAVLVRARSDFADLHAALTSAGLPVEVVGLGGLLALPEVADVVATLEVVDDPTANAALIRLLTGPRWRIGPRDLAALGRTARRLVQDARGGPDSPDGALEEAVAGTDPADLVALADALDRPGPEVSPEAAERLQALAAELRHLRAARDEPLLDLVHRVVETSGLDVELSASPDAVAARRRESLQDFLDTAAGFADLEGGGDLTAFLGFLRAAEEHERGLDSSTPTGRAAVQLLTAHKSKGLEWDVVVCPDVTRGTFPADRLRDRWPKAAHVLPVELRGDAHDQPTLLGFGKDDVARYDDDCREHLSREERRLGYVALTRARRLLLTSGHWWGPTQVKPRGPSPLLEELREHALSGGGTVELWTEPPAEKRNPLLAEAATFQWPVPYDEAAWARRRAAADQVLADVAHPPEDPDAGLTPRERERFARYDREMALLLEEERRSRSGVREVELPTALTASQLLRLAQDPDGLARELARPLPRRPVPAARRGTRFHAWVEERFGQRPLLGPDDLPGAEDDALGDDEALRALQDAFLASPYADRRPHAVEAPFALPVGGRVVRGRIDAVYALPDGRWEVVDWKTGTEDADPLQLAVYRCAWARLAGVPLSAVDAAFVYVRDGRVERYPDLPDEAGLAALLAAEVPTG